MKLYVSRPSIDPSNAAVGLHERKRYSRQARPATVVLLVVTYECLHAT